MHICGRMRGTSSKLAALLSLGLLPGLPLRGAEVYTVDTVHSTALFKVKHLGASNSYGRFNDISGKVALDPADPQKSSVELQVKAESIDTANQKRDQHLRGPDFFNVKEFPLITFKSKEVKKTGDATYEVSGDLTLHGVTRPLTVKVERTGSGKNPRGGDLAGYETTFTLKRSDFGMKFMVGPVGDEVQITVSVEGTRA